MVEITGFDYLCAYGACRKAIKPDYLYKMRTVHGPKLATPIQVRDLALAVPAYDAIRPGTFECWLD